MPRKPVPFIPQNPYHISSRCINREWFELPLDVVWSIMEDYLFLLDHGFGTRIHAFVLMSNHFHLIMTSPQGNMSAALLYFMRETSREITRLTGRINQTYGSRNHKTHIGSYHHLLNTYKYIYRNPVRAGICSRVEEYAFSTLHGLFGFKPLIIPVTEIQNFDETALRWLNTEPKCSHDQEIRAALRRPDFELKASRKTGRLSDLEGALL